MELTKPKIEYSAVTENADALPVIVVAAGNAARMQGIDKQLLSVGGIPVIARTLRAFENCPYISKIIVVTKKDSVLSIQNICNEYFLDKVTDITVGGETRHESVICGMRMLSPLDKKVLIHDGARPFVTGEMIKDCVVALKEYDGCLCAVKMSDTVKRVNPDLTVKTTVDRADLYAAQTPQGVSVAEYLRISEENKGADFTDDAAVLEAGGKRVKIVNGGRNNIKITTREDIAVAEAILKSSEGNQ